MTHLVYSLVSVKETICDAKHWLRGKTTWTKMWLKSPNLPNFPTSRVPQPHQHPRTFFVLQIWLHQSPTPAPTSTPPPHRTLLWRLWRNICGDFAVLNKVTIPLYMHCAQCVTISILMLHLLRRTYTCMQSNKINHKFKISILLSNNSVKMENDKSSKISNRALIGK